MSNLMKKAPKKRLLPAYETNLTQYRTGWKSDATSAVGFDEAVQLFIASRVRSGARPKTRQMYQTHLEKYLFGWMKETKGRRTYSDVTNTDIHEWVEALRGSNYADATKNMLLRTARGFFHWTQKDHEAKQRGLVSHLDALPTIRKIEGRLWIPSPDEMRQFLESFDQDVVWGFRDYVIASLMLDCGARIGEICNMELSDVKWDVGMLRVPKGEGSKTGERLINIDRDTTIPLLRKWLRVREKFARPNGRFPSRLFISRNGGCCTNNAIGHEFAKIRQRTGIGQHEEGAITPHTFRHYFCTYYLVNGGTLHNLQYITGHTELQTLMIYVHQARTLTAVKEEHSRVSPLKNLELNSGATRKKRQMY